MIVCTTCAAPPINSSVPIRITVARVAMKAALTASMPRKINAMPSTRNHTQFLRKASSSFCSGFAGYDGVLMA